jgi:hypothetical protein
MNDPVEMMARHAADRPFFLAWLLSAYAQSEGLDDAGLAKALGCSPQTLTMLRLCRAPRTDAAEFREDVRCIAERFAIEPMALAEAVKRGRVVRGMRAAAAEAATLMAARDREEGQP